MTDTKLTGLGGAIAVDDSSGTPQTISDYVTNFAFTTPRAVQDVTGVDKSANQRLLLLADFTVTFNGPFTTSDDGTAAHDVFNTVASTTVIRTVKITPTSGTHPFLSCETYFTDYQITRSNAGELTYQAPGSLADGTVPTWTNS